MTERAIFGFKDMIVIASIFDLFERVGREAYVREGVSQRAHALQAAALAEAEGAARLWWWQRCCTTSVICYSKRMQEVACTEARIFPTSRLGQAGLNRCSDLPLRNPSGCTLRQTIPVCVGTRLCKAAPGGVPGASCDAGRCHDAGRNS